MGVINCKTSNELVSVNLANPALVVNIYEQDNGMLIALSDGLHDIQALQYAKRPATDVLAELEAKGQLEADELYVVTPTSDGSDEDEDGEDADADEDEDEDGEDWQANGK